MDYLGLITSLPCTLISIIAGYLSIAYDTVLELSMSAYELLLGLSISAYEILLGLAISAYELLLGLAVGVSDLLSLQEWWATENTIMAVWLVIVLPALCKRSSGKFQEIYLQLVSALTGLMLFGSFIQTAGALQGGGLFGGKVSMPTLGLLGVVVMMFGANIDGIKKEIYGYGVSDGPGEEKCASVFGSIEKFIGLETVIFFCIATFGLPSIDIGAEDYNYTPLLCVFPILGMVREMNTYFEPEVEEPVVAEEATDLNGLPPQPNEEEAKTEDAEKEAETPAEKEEEEAVPDTKEAETEEKSEETVETEEKAEEKVEEEAATETKEEPAPSIVTKIITKIKGLVGCVINLILTMVGKVKSLITCVLTQITAIITCVITRTTSLISCVITKTTSLIKCVIAHIVAMPWNCIINTTICLGTKATLTYTFWYLTEDLLVIAFPVIDIVLPYLVSKAEARELLSDNASHVISQTAALVAGCAHYYLFRTYSAATPA